MHIGATKTGTTDIQEAMHIATPALAAQFALVPRTDRPPWPRDPKHASVSSAAASTDPSRAAAERATLQTEFEASGAHTMLISDEGLAGPNSAHSDFFAPLARRFELRVVCFLRRPDRFVESLFNQWVREPVRREGRNILQLSRAPAVRQRLEYHTMLQRWQALPAQVHARSYDGLSGPHALLDSFTDAAGLSVTLQPSAQTVNPSPDVRVALAMQRLSSAQVPFDASAMVNAARQLQRDERFPLRRTLLGRDERRRLLSELEPELLRLKADFGVQFDDTLPDGEAAGPTEEPDLAYMVELAAALSRKGL